MQRAKKTRNTFWCAEFFLVYSAREPTTDGFPEQHTRPLAVRDKGSVCWRSGRQRRGRVPTPEKMSGTARVQANEVCAKRFKSGPRNQKDNHPFGWFFFLERCVPCGNVMRTTCVMRPSDVMCASRVNWNTSHHCEQSEQHHYTARCSITCPPGQTSLYKADVFCFHIRPSSYNPEVVVVGVTFCNQQCEPI